MIYDCVKVQYAAISNEKWYTFTNFLLFILLDVYLDMVKVCCYTWGEHNVLYKLKARASACSEGLLKELG